MLPMPARLRWSSSASPTGRSGSAVSRRSASLLVPVGAEQVGAEVADRRRPRGRAGAARRCRAEADRRAPSAARAPPGPGGRAAPALRRGGRRARSPPSSGGCAAVHCRRRRDAGEQVLAARDGLDDACRRPGRRWRAAAPGSRCGSARRPRAPRRAAGRCARRCHPQAPLALSRSPRGVGDEPGRLQRLAQRGRAASRAAARRRPSRRSAGPARRAGRPRPARRPPGPSRSASSVQVSRVRPPRST